MVQVLAALDKESSVAPGTEGGGAITRFLLLKCRTTVGTIVKRFMLKFG